MSYKKARSEFDSTVSVVKHTIDGATMLNRARDEAARGAASAAAVGDTLATVASVLLVCAGKLLDADTRAYSRRLESNHPRNIDMKTILTALAILLIPVVALAQASLPADLPVDLAAQQLIATIGGMKGAGALGIAIAVIQAVMLFFRTPLANFAGKWKLLIVAALSMVLTYLGLVLSGTPWLTALVTGPFVAGIQVFAHQIVLQFKAPAA